MRFQLNWEDAVVTGIRDVTPTVREFLITPTGGRAHTLAPGSHINISVLIDGKPDTRSYSLVGAPRGGHYRIAVKRQDNSRGGSRYMWALAPGARLLVSDPQNLFTLDYDRPQYLLVAGGIGITPLYGMAEALKRRGADFRLVYAARSRAELAFADELRATLGEHLEPRTGDDMPLNLDEEIARLGRDGDLYVCGPVGLLEAARGIWSRTGRPRANLRYETFGSSGHAPTRAFTVRIPNLGLDVTVPKDRSMLEALEAAGVGVVSDCRRGECGVCKVRVLSSDGVIDHRDVFFAADEHAAGDRMCPCVSRVDGGSITLDTWYRPDTLSRTAR